MKYVCVKHILLDIHPSQLNCHSMFWAASNKNGWRWKREKGFMTKLSVSKFFCLIIFIEIDIVKVDWSVDTNLSG